MPAIKTVLVAVIPPCDWCHDSAGEFDTPPNASHTSSWSHCCASCLPVWGRPDSTMTRRWVVA